MITLEPLSFLMKEIYSEDCMLCHGNYGKTDKYWCCHTILSYHTHAECNIDYFQKMPDYVLSAQHVFNLTTEEEQAH